MTRAQLFLLVAAGIVGGAGAAAWSGPPVIYGTGTQEAVSRVPAARIALSSSQTGAVAAKERPVRSVLNISKPLDYGGFVWNDRGVPAGRTWIRVDLGSQLISVFRAGHEIGTAVILYGAAQHQTPTGVFPILWKKQNHRSITYDAAMPYTLRLTEDGVSIHGSDVKWGTATHGCIGVPLRFAELLYRSARPGDEVVIVADRLKTAQQS